MQILGADIKNKLLCIHLPNHNRHNVGRCFRRWLRFFHASFEDHSTASLTNEILEESIQNIKVVQWSSILKSAASSKEIYAHKSTCLWVWVAKSVRAGAWGPTRTIVGQRTRTFFANRFITGICGSVVVVVMACSTREYVSVAVTEHQNSGWSRNILNSLCCFDAEQRACQVH